MPLFLCAFLVVFSVFPVRNISMCRFIQKQDFFFPGSQKKNQQTNKKQTKNPTSQKLCFVKTKQRVCVCVWLNKNFPFLWKKNLFSTWKYAWSATICPWHSDTYRWTSLFRSAVAKGLSLWAKSKCQLFLPVDGVLGKMHETQICLTPQGGTLSLYYRNV